LRRAGKRERILPSVTSRRLALAAVVTLALAVTVGAPAGATAPPGQDHAATAAAGKKRSIADYPWQRRMKRAVRFARRRAGSVSFAVVDERGHIHGFHRGRRYSSASVVKAMLLVAYLRKGGVRGRRLHGSEKATLGPMIRRSDNAAATAIHNNVGNRGLRRLARRAGMRRFIPSSVWGGSQITARDQARFFFRIRGLVPPRHRAYALGLLRRVVPGQRWGVPPGKPKGWRVHFKGGWTPSGGGWRVHQAALLRSGNRRLAVAVLTEGDPSLGYGAGTITGVTRRLLRGYNAYVPGKRGGGKRPKSK
jgi:Beta-lactamase enzyme family